MRKSAAALVGTLLVAAIVLVWTTHAKAETVTGKLVDLNCYALNKENTGNNHPGIGNICAQACAREGFTVGLLTSDEKVYFISGDMAANENAKLVAHMAHTVTLTGDVTQKDGTAWINVTDLKMVSK